MVFVAPDEPAVIETAAGTRDEQRFIGERWANAAGRAAYGRFLAGRRRRHPGCTGVPRRQDADRGAR